MRHKGRAASKGFSLIEVLVVIAIVIVIAAIIGVVYPRVKGSAQTTTCTSNMRQLWQASLIYAQDNGDYLPPWLTYDETGWSGDIAALAQPETSDHPAARWRTALMTYAKSKEIFLCPSDPYGGKLVPVEFMTLTRKEVTSYAHSLEMDKFRDKQFKQLTTLATSDGESGIAYMNCSPIGSKDLANGNKGAVYSHNQSLNTLFLDGHSKLIPFPLPN